MSERGAARLAGMQVPRMRHGDAGPMAASGARSAHSGQRALGMRSPSGVVAVAWPGGTARAALAAEAAGAARQPGRGHAAVPRVGLVFPSRLPFEAWQGIGTHLAVAASSSAWCLGDWLVYGQAAYARRYREAVEQTGLDYQTLRNYAWVARRFELSRRRERLSFGHHAEVAALPEPEQDFWLRKAEEFGWPVMRLRREVRASLAEREHGPAELESAGDGRRGGRPQERRLAVIRVTLTPGQRALCERAASEDGEDLHAWAATALERAASKQLAAPS